MDPNFYILLIHRILLRLPYVGTLLGRICLSAVSWIRHNRCSFQSDDRVVCVGAEETEQKLRPKSSSGLGFHTFFLVISTRLG